VNVPRLAGPRVALVPPPPGLAAAAVDGMPVGPLLAPAGLGAGDGWPHDDTADALTGAAVDGDAATWLVVLGDVVVGECGWKGPPDVDGTVEIGYGLAAPARGKGVGTEVVAVLVAWTETRPGVRAVAADVLPGNAASLRLLQRLGFDEVGGDGRYLRLERGPQRVRGRHVC
jgi:RimJ/RimL family protein N-acetyltransferase